MFSDFYDYKYAQKLLENINSPLAENIPIESVITQILILIGIFFQVLSFCWVVKMLGSGFTTEPSF